MCVMHVPEECDQGNDSEHRGSNDDTDFATFCDFTEVDVFDVLAEVSSSVENLCGNVSF